jgi:hypothetical protein
VRHHSRYDAAGCIDKYLHTSTYSGSCRNTQEQCAFERLCVLAWCVAQVHTDRPACSYTGGRCVVSLGPWLRLSGPVSRPLCGLGCARPVLRPVCGLGCGCLVRLRFALRSLAVWRVCAIAPSFVSGWRAFSSISLCNFTFTERDGRKGPPAGNKAKCNSMKLYKWQARYL